MKPSAAGVAVFSGLATVVAADALPMDSIPLECVKVCGPIVELTNICNTSVDSRRRALKRRTPNGDVPKLAAAHSQRLQSGARHGRGCGGLCQRDKHAHDAAKRQFSVIRQAPTSFPPDVLAPPPETTAAQPTRPVIQTTAALPTAHNPPPPPTDQTNAHEGDTEDIDAVDNGGSSSSNISSSGSSPTAANGEPTETAASDGSDDDDEDWWMPDGAEQQCVCMNESFDVSRLTSLCASCVDQTGDETNNINIIVDTCKFDNSGETYTRKLDRVADGVRVRATRPAVEMHAVKQSSVATEDALGGSESSRRGHQAVMVVAGLCVWAAAAAVVL